MKSRAKILLVMSAVITFALLASAEPISQLHPTDYVNDFAHVLDQQTVVQPDDICRQIDQKAHAQIAVVTINSLDGSDIESYAADLYKKWGVGDKSTNRGVVILLAVKDHRYRIEVGYGLEPILPDGKVGGFGREAVPLLKQNDYAGALLLMTSRVAEVIAKDAGVELTGGRAEAPPQQQPSQPPSAFRILFIIFIILIVLFTPLRRLVFWWLLLGGRGGGWGGGGGGWGGGGFGGGGGGFGGFGGGSSGGGGASGSW
ncbi:MAG: methanol dehydrogenase [Acidobacteria bacterium]|nr:MAG: methanol dehydrogenase [Acidobacteriota bacterium]